MQLKGDVCYPILPVGDVETEGEMLETAHYIGGRARIRVQKYLIPNSVFSSAIGHLIWSLVPWIFTPCGNPYVFCRLFGTFSCCHLTLVYPLNDVICLPSPPLMGITGQWNGAVIIMTEICSQLYVFHPQFLQKETHRSGALRADSHSGVHLLWNLAMGGQF